ncbi:alpha/beta fold hydrolase [Natronorubrum tibetense]|uniref:Alpha/beta hydrolase fold protein n=1 Tax=Natronorubrum tibetense GA33 TaxID=1114856 RepID=L9VZP6_9EURY|nr:alpha/beta hydrolase [Natronorubrum tibetense]ELY41523.1 alpha/beta hydrolase fold protein [Natronorubrum tibetense GA33]
MADIQQGSPEKEIATVTSTDGTEIAYERSGSGPPLVLVHGAIFDRTIWELGDVRSTFAEHTTVYAMDRRNHGDSESSDDVSVEAQFDDVVAVVESIDDPVHLLGHSAGANFALGAAPRIDNLRSLILHEPAGEPSDEDRDVIEEMMALLDEGQNEQALALFLGDFAQFSSDELDELRSAPIWDTHTDTFHQTLLPLIEAHGEVESDLTPFEDLSTPTLLLVGSESGWLKNMAEELHDTLPNSRLATFEGHGHAPHLVAPDRCADKVLSFIGEVD